MKLIDKKEMSEWAYWQCRNGDDTQEIRDLITDTLFMYKYYKNVKKNRSFLNKLKKESKQNKELRTHLFKKYLRFNNREDLTFKIPKEYENNGFTFPVKKNKEEILRSIQLLDKSKKILSEKKVKDIVLNSNIRLTIYWSLEE